MRGRQGATLPEQTLVRYAPAMPHQPVPPKNRSFARAMRREMTEAEEKLCSELRSRRLDRIKFRQQAPIGNYIEAARLSRAALLEQ
jgi:very-short-patch-repair endonuclease